MSISTLPASTLPASTLPASTLPQSLKANDEVKTEIQKVNKLIGLNLSESEIAELVSGKPILLEDRLLSEIGSIFILAETLYKVNFLKAVTFQELLKVTSDCLQVAGIPIYSLSSEVFGKSFLFLTLVNGQPAVKISSQFGELAMNERTCVSGSKVRTGIDLVHLSDIQEVVDETTDLILTKSEWENISNLPDRLQRLAGKFACKEAILKALGKGIEQVELVDVEILQDSFGKPIVFLRGTALDCWQQTGLTQLEVSISHHRDYGVGIAVAM